MTRGLSGGQVSTHRPGLQSDLSKLNCLSRGLETITNTDHDTVPTIIPYTATFSINNVMDWKNYPRKYLLSQI